ncbi:MAG TPA: 3'-5' exonuclease [Coriobacteriia bacterium]|nr:3'-5' exonuclease [Coriobacteriia bacterium]
MYDDLWVAIDFETATNEPNSACAVGVALIDGTEFVRARSWLVQPPANEYRWYCTNVHGITADDTSQAPEFDEVWPEVREYVVGQRLLAHNAPFDARVLGALAERYDFDLEGAAFACTVAMSRKAFPALANHKLSTVCSARSIPLTHHQAESDAIACAHVAIDCAHETGAASIGEAIELLGLRMRSV